MRSHGASGRGYGFNWNISTTAADEGFRVILTNDGVAPTATNELINFMQHTTSRFRLMQGGNLFLNGLSNAVAPSYILSKQTDSSVATLTSVPVALGGTGLTATTVGGILLGTGTTTFSNLAIGANNTVLKSNGTTASWQPITATDEGTYSPTLTVVSNITGTPTASTFHYVVTGNSVHVWGRITLDPTTTATATELGISLPPSWNIIGSVEALIGHATIGTLNETMTVQGDVGNQRATMIGLVTDVSSRTMNVSFILRYTPS